MSSVSADLGAVSLDPEILKLLVQLIGLTIPPDDRTPLASLLYGQLTVIASLDELDLTDVTPALEFDPRW